MNWSGHCADIVPDARRFRPRSGETSMNLRPFAAACLASVLLAACSTVPQPLQGEFNQITPREAAELDSTGALVRWGGRIVQVEPKRSEEHTSELQSLMRISYAVFCLKKKKKSK